MSNALQTNATLIDKNWCDLFRQYQWLLGVSLDGPEEVNDLYRFNKEKHGTWKRVMQSIELLTVNKVEFNILCVLSTANVEKPKELYRFYRSLGARFDVAFTDVADRDAGFRQHVSGDGGRSWWRPADFARNGIRISFMNSSRRSLPRSICLSLNSQSPVSSGEMSSGMLSPRNSAMSENALAVGTSSRPARKRYFS